MLMHGKLSYGEDMVILHTGFKFTTPHLLMNGVFLVSVFMAVKVMEFGKCFLNSVVHFTACNICIYFVRVRIEN
jgi:hypothetical protein